MPHRLISHLERQRIIEDMRTYHNGRAIWLAAFSALIMTIVMIIGAISPQTHHLYTNFHILFVFITNTIIFAALYLYNFFIIRTPLFETKKLIIALVGSLLIATMIGSICYLAEELIYGHDNVSNNYGVGIGIHLSAALIAFLISLLLTNITRHQATLIENEHLQAENMIIRYETLEQQLSPHFLFNSLNTLDGLIGIDDDNAHLYLQQLAATFRYIIQRKNTVSLKEELDFTHSYIYMMQIRHGDNLLIHETIAPEMMQYNTVPISLQLLIENVIKHNIISNRHPMHITITTTDHNSIIVANPLQPKADQEAGSGIGLENLSQRYKMIFATDINILRTDNHFSVELPLIPTSTTTAQKNNLTT